MNDGNYFKSSYDINKFARYMRQTIDESEDLHDLIFETDNQRNYAIRLRCLYQEQIIQVALSIHACFDEATKQWLSIFS